MVSPRNIQKEGRGDQDTTPNIRMKSLDLLTNVNMESTISRLYMDLPKHRLLQI